MSTNDLLSDDPEADLSEVPLEVLRDEYDALAAEIADLDYMIILRKAQFAEYEAEDHDLQALRRGRATHARFRADHETERREILSQRKRLTAEMRRRTDNRQGLRTPVYLLGTAIMAYEADPNADEADLFALLDSIRVEGNGKVYSLRDFLNSGAKW